MLLVLHCIVALFPTFVLLGCGGAGDGGDTPQVTTTGNTPQVTTTGNTPQVATTSVTTPDPGLSLQEKVTVLLQNAADIASKKFDCAISLGFKNAEFEAAAASGVIDRGTGAEANITDKYLFGSCTKMVTGASILRLVADGAIGLDDPIQALVDPYLSRLAAAERSDIKQLADAFDAKRLKGLTVRRLAHMSTGLPDFNTAHAKKADPLRDLSWKSMDRVLSLLKVLDLPWVRGKWTKCRGNSDLDADCYRYSNTNFMLLGLVLADQTGAKSWTDLDQAQFLPDSCKDGSIHFGIQNPPSSFTPAHGYDRTKFRADGKDDFYDMVGEFSGLTAVNMVATPLGVARFGWELYGPNHSVLPKKYVEMMHAGSPGDRYGIGTQLGRGITGQAGAYGDYYGHTGTRYGYQSFMQYFPAMSFALAGASNIETDHHPQTNVALCFAYNYIAAELLGQDGMTCTYDTECKCTALKDSREVEASSLFI